MKKFYLAKLFKCLDQWGWHIALGFLLFSWISLLSRMSLWWNEASYYTHGWAVPVLSLLLLAQRNSDWKVSNKTPISPWHILAIGFLLLLPSRILSEPDPFWRVPLWGETIAHCLATGLFIYQNGKRICWQSWAWTSLYLCTALPWPSGLESAIIHELTSLVSLLTAECLLLLGYPAEISANAIMVDQQKVTINQACSGIRSFQNLISLSIFLSVYFRYGWGRILPLIILSVACTLIFNFFRAVTLSYVFLDFGPEVQEQWHDFIGNFFVTLSMLCIGGIAWLIKPEDQNQKELNKAEPKAVLNESKPWPFSVIFGTPMILVYLWFSLLGPEVPTFSWEVKLGANTEPIEAGVKDVLLFDYGEKINFNNPNSNQVEVIHFGYYEDSAAESLCSRNHPPDYCMGYSGIRLVDSNSEIKYYHKDEPLHFRHYSTPSKGVKKLSDLHVFWGSFTLDNRINSFEFKPVTVWEKATWFLSGKLSFERKVLLITINGPKSKMEAKKELVTTLEKIVTSKKAY